MILSIDIGGTKTLLAKFDKNATLIAKHKFPTPKMYNSLLETIRQESENIISGTETIEAITVAIPAPINYKTGESGLGNKFGWEESNVQHDLSKIFECPVYQENDANLAALAEAMLGNGKGYNTVLYITISTGIGTGIVQNNTILPALAPSEGGLVFLNYEGGEQQWEKFGSGKAFVERYGKLGSEINDLKIWKSYAVSSLASGFMNLILVVNPDIIVVGGGMGSHLEKYHSFLVEELDRLGDIIQFTLIPEITVAKLPNKAVVYGGCLLAINNLKQHSPSL